MPIGRLFSGRAPTVLAAAFAAVVASSLAGGEMPVASSKRSTISGSGIASAAAPRE